MARARPQLLGNDTARGSQGKGRKLRSHTYITKKLLPGAAVA